jgi:hypothetical protein
MASIISKKVNGGTYYYLREMARVGGKPKMVFTVQTLRLLVAVPDR